MRTGRLAAHRLQRPLPRWAAQLWQICSNITAMGEQSFFGTCVPVPHSIRRALKELIGGPAAEATDRIRVREHSIFARLHGHATATTRRGCIFLAGSAVQFFADPALMLHEYCHVLMQWESGVLTVPRYVRESLLRGYWNNRYEVQAREFTRHRLGQFRTLLAQTAPATRSPDVVASTAPIRSRSAVQSRPPGRSAGGRNR